TGDARLILRPAPGQALLVGVEHATERQRGADSSNYDLSPNHFSAGRITRAAYAQWTGDAGRASWSLGSRYDDNDVYGIFRTARVAAAWRTWRGARVRGAVGGGFKAPTFLETFSGAFSVGNPALRPERSRGWEVGAEQRLPGRVTLGATYFDQRFRDLIQYTFRAPTDPNYFNVAAASARGLELEARTEPTAGVAVWGTATALRTRVDDAGFQSGAGATFVNGRRLLRRPPLTLSAGAAVSRIPRTRVDLALTHVGARDDRDFSTYPATPVELAGYSRMDVGLTCTLADGGGFWRASALTARLENALGAAYEEVANFAAPGRVVMLGLRVGTLR
ncbi:MAG: TonB-dependent receptor, partial [Gemmatimonadaceae bacterium]